LYTWCWRSTLLAGGFGVDLFFVLSSYLITSLLVREADAAGHIDVPAFWMRRVLRIWPLYFSFVLGYALVGGISPRMTAAMSTFGGNWAMAAWGDGAGLADPLWSVSVEEQFLLSDTLDVGVFMDKSGIWIVRGGKLSIRTDVALCDSLTVRNIKIESLKPEVRNTILSKHPVELVGGD
jgi:hypothetical protein